MKISSNLTECIRVLLEHTKHILAILPTVNTLSEDDHHHHQKILQHTQQIEVEIQTVLQQMTTTNSLEHLLHATRHDLRNHVNAMLGFAEILIEDHTGTNLPELELIMTNTKLILQEINNLQIQSKTRKHKISVTPTPRVEDLEPDLVKFKKDFSILIVDDITENCQLLEKHLIRTGFKNIRIANNALDAKTVLAKNKIDLVLLDIEMPDVSGIALLEELKQDIAKLQLMVIMVTGADTIENAIQCIKLGAEDFLTKPIDTEMLRVRIDASLRKKWFLLKQKEYAEYLEIERKRYADLLNAIFPPTIVTELSEKGHVIARSYSNVSMLFVDVVGFTQYCDTHSLDQAIEGIQDFSAICEAAASKYNLQKIKTIGDGFLAIAGMLTEHQNPVKDCILTAIEILENTKNAPNQWLVRAGIDFGTIIGGIVGHRQYLFDVWGDSVNTAARAQSAASPDKICLTARAWETVKTECDGHSMGVVALKGKGVPIELFEFEKMRG